MATFWNVALWIYEFSAILCFLLLVKLTFRLSKEINDQLEIDFLVNPLKTAFLCFWQNFFHIMIPLWNTFICVILIIIHFVPNLDSIMRESVQNGIKKVGNEKNMTEEEIKKTVKEKYEKVVDNSDEE
jgi:predicted membrane protein